MKQILLMLLLGTSLALTQGAHAKIALDYSNRKFNERELAQQSDKYMPTLTNLKVLSLDKNQIDSFKYMPALTNLEFLVLDDNKIKSFEHMPTLTNLEFLSLKNNL